MTQITVRVPVRADLAGGTLDLWPLYLFHPGSRTVNVAVSCFAECEISHTHSGIEIYLSDTDYRRKYESAEDVAKDPAVALIGRALEHFGTKNVRIITRTDAPRGSGLGGSSALSIALVRGLSEVAEQPVEGEELIALVRDLETRLIAAPAGVQDYYPAVYGGLGSLHLNPGKIARHPISFPLPDLAEHFILHYSGVAHFSGTNNWEVYKRHIDGDTKIQDGLQRIAETSIEMERALEGFEIQRAGEALFREWKYRKELISGISNDEIEACVDTAMKSGAWGAKVCGAGGGGCIVILAPKEDREKIVEALASVPGETLDAFPVPHGLVLERSEEEETVRAVPPPRRSRTSIDVTANVDQLYLATEESGAYKPWAVAEAAVTWDEPRAGIRKQVYRAFAAPISLHTEQIDWSKAAPVELESLEMTAIPDATRAKEEDGDSLLAAIARGEEEYRDFLVGREKLTAWHNPSFGLYSEVDESRADFEKRCLQEAESQLRDHSGRLEATFRRRIDQMRERAERDQRRADDESGSTADSPDVSIAWGQTLYNITSGRSIALEPESVDEADYMQKIALLQKTWDRELDELREELHDKARQLEELQITPSRRNIELTRFLVLWAPAL